ncbi:hypothetical protein SKAU_G00283460 [Synaphobranchus kaupii]|uniref:Uncharacterized protein n=1 Tax=Synaphobranchus kaupii TaxID=118154 RepID=A0A9Q1IP67_SYNKA|nr:hypothetical protein SKAU_G00283460 [Synaphobranchus kaupii]
MGKCKFNALWLENGNFSPWLKSVQVAQLTVSSNLRLASTSSTNISTFPPTASSGDLRTTFGSTPTLQAEVLWTLHTVAKHQSYNANEGIGSMHDHFRVLTKAAPSLPECVEQLNLRNLVSISMDGPNVNWN